MITVRRASERGASNHGWLDSKHTFSFADYHDPEHMGFRALRVINDDRVSAGSGFGTHGHRDMEILSYVLSGALEHKDSMGNGSVIRPGDVQRMSAGTGVMHSEKNHSGTDPVHFLQIWILPEKRGTAPGYEQRTFDEGSTRDQLRLVASRDGRDDSVTVAQDLALYVAKLSPGTGVQHALAPGRHVWIHVATGSVTLDGQALGPGDGAAIVDEARLDLRGTRDAEVLLFDLA